jgi:hypothetical protein
VSSSTRRAAIVGALILVAGATPVHADEGDRFDGGTVGAQAVAGTLGVIVGGGLGLIGGGLIGFAAGKNPSGNSSSIPSNFDGPLVGAAIGGIIGGEIGLVYGVQHWGDKHQGTGSLRLTIAGGLVGLGGALGVGYLAIKAKLPLPVVGVLAGTMLVATPIVFYHLSGDEHAATTARVVPLLITVF